MFLIRDCIFWFFFHSEHYFYWKVLILRYSQSILLLVYDYILFSLLLFSSLVVPRVFIDSLSGLFPWYWTMFWSASRMIAICWFLNFIPNFSSFFDFFVSRHICVLFLNLFDCSSLMFNFFVHFFSSGDHCCKIGQNAYVLCFLFLRWLF